MFVLSRDVAAAYRAIATLLAIALVLFVIGAHSFAQAANVTDVSDLLSDSAPGVVSNHTIAFGTPTGIGSGETITITFPAGFNMGSVAFGDIDVNVSGSEQTLAGSPSGTTWGAAVGGQTLTLTNGTTAFGANATVTVSIGTNATGGTNQITNPGTVGSYEIAIAGTMADSGFTRVAIVDTVAVTASVDTSFVFTVIGNATSTVVNGTTTTIAASSTTIPFGTLVASEIETIAQDLTVQTNAINGFVVTVESDQSLLSSTGADIDNFANNTIGNPATWSSPSNLIADENTWGHWGVTTEDTNTTRTVEFGSNEWVGVTTTPTVIFSHDGPSDGVTAGIGSTTVGYQIEISPLQEAGDDYSTTLTYIATPTF